MLPVSHTQREDMQFPGGLFQIGFSAASCADDNISSREKHLRNGFAKSTRDLRDKGDLLYLRRFLGSCKGGNPLTV